MGDGLESLPDDIDALKAALIVARAEAAAARARQSDDQALIAHLKLQIEKLNRDRYGPRSERTARLLDQLELTLEELESSATEDELAAEKAAAKTTKVSSFTRKRPSRQPFPEHLPRERVVVPGPVACACCGGARLSKLGEDITETLEVIPKSWKVIQHVREKFSCRDCEKISQAPAPFHVIARGWAGPSFLAMVLFEKFGQHQPLNRQAERYAKEGVPISLSTLADQVGGCTVALMPLFRRLEAHVLRAERLHGDDTTVPVRAAMMYSLIVTAKMNDVDPQAWLADVLARIAAHPVQRLDELLPWNWRDQNKQVDKAAWVDGYAVFTGCLPLFCLVPFCRRQSC
jgi:transposase